MASLHEERRGADVGPSDVGLRPDPSSTARVARVEARGSAREPKPVDARSPYTIEARAPREIFPRIVTVSREFGAGGGRIAAQVADDLGFQLWDRELVTHLARKADADPGLLRELDERKRDLIDDVISTALYGVWVSASKYRSLLARAVGELAERGGAVIVGRGANFLVSAEQALRVRVVCPLRERIERYARMGKVDWARAERLVRSKDRERERFARQLCGETSRDPSHYDLIINTGDLSEHEGARLVLAAYHARFYASLSDARSESSDAALRL